MSMVIIQDTDMEKINLLDIDKIRDKYHQKELERRTMDIEINIDTFKFDISWNHEKQVMEVSYILNTGVRAKWQVTSFKVNEDYEFRTIIQFTEGLTVIAQGNKLRIYANIVEGLQRKKKVEDITDDDIKKSCRILNRGVSNVYNEILNVKGIK